MASKLPMTASSGFLKQTFWQNSTTLAFCERPDMNFLSNFFTKMPDLVERCIHARFILARSWILEQKTAHKPFTKGGKAPAHDSQTLKPLLTVWLCKFACLLVDLLRQLTCGGHNETNGSLPVTQLPLLHQVDQHGEKKGSSLARTSLCDALGLGLGGQVSGWCY